MITTLLRDAECRVVSSSLGVLECFVQGVGYDIVEKKNAADHTRA